MMLVLDISKQTRKKCLQCEVTHWSSLRVDGLPNCVAVDLSKL
jgi:hypothetical protein